MGKNWLIRTKSNHILGPISKEKVLELYQNGSIKPDDEVCSGNGYWFFIREADLVQKFLIGNEAQGFNPMSEAKDVLTATTSLVREATLDDITLVGTLKLSQLQEPPPLDVRASEPGPASADPLVSSPSEDRTLPDLRIQDLGDSPVAKKTEKKKDKVDSRTKVPASVKSVSKQDYLKYLAVLGFLLLFLLIYFRKTFIRSFKSSTGALIETAVAQDESPKKKNFLSK